MKVYVVTRVEHAQSQSKVYYTVKATKEDAEKYIRERYSDVRENRLNSSNWSYLCMEHGWIFVFVITEEII